jgi:hypothetical protein
VFILNPVTSERDLAPLGTVGVTDETVTPVTPQRVHHLGRYGIGIMGCLVSVDAIENDHAILFVSDGEGGIIVPSTAYVSKGGILDA